MSTFNLIHLNATKMGHKWELDHPSALKSEVHYASDIGCAH